MYEDKLVFAYKEDKRETLSRINKVKKPESKTVIHKTLDSFLIQ